ncbi:MAG: RNA-splicing ligase RtcB, partial [Candidatus Nealsonbacteria bacterium CG_4_8_14_3_um_filter_40_11]
MQKSDFKKITGYLWEIPKSFRSDMQVPARIYASEEILGDVEEDAIKQVINVATLPGIVKYSLAMPDIHTGYGFVIGGVAATNFPEGMISPGGIGYDQNCLSGDTKVLHSLGYYLPMKSLEKKDREEIKCVDFKKDKIENSIPFNFLRKETPSILKITTKTRREIKATPEHPFYTPEGMVELRKLNLRDKIAIYSFEGVSYKKPLNRVIIDEKDVRGVLKKAGIK